jgi:RNA polymerase sigma factor (sigma-70 family)
MRATIKEPPEVAGMWEAYLDSNHSPEHREPLVKHYIGLAYRTACIYHRGHEAVIDLEDLVSLASERLSLAIESYDPTRGAQPATWLIRCMRQKLSYEVSGKRHPLRGVTNHDWYTAREHRNPTPDAGYVEAERIIASIPEIDDAARVLLRRHFIDGDSLAQIAREEGVCREAIRQRILRALAHCRLAKSA